jgi:hypothetical protein
LLSLFLNLLLDVGDNVWLDVSIVILWLQDLDLIWHDLLVGTNANFDALHDLDLETEDTLTELDVTDSNINEFLLWLTSGDLVTSVVLQGLGTLTTDLTRDNNFATSGITTAHDSSENVVSGHTDWDTVQELELKGLNVGGGGQVLVVWEWLDGELNLVVFIVEVVALLDEGLDLLNLTGVLVKQVLALGGTDTDLSAHVGGTDLDTGVALHTESAGQKLVQLSLENTISNELSLGGNLLSNLLVSHLY